MHPACAMTSRRPRAFARAAAGRDTAALDHISTASATVPTTALPVRRSVATARDATTMPKPDAAAAWPRLANATSAHPSEGDASPSPDTAVELIMDPSRLRDAVPPSPPRGVSASGGMFSMVSSRPDVDSGAIVDDTDALPRAAQWSVEQHVFLPSSVTSIMTHERRGCFSYTEVQLFSGARFGLY